MTEEERQRLIEAKAAVTSRLASECLDDYQLTKVDKRLDMYVRSVAEHPGEHNLWEQLGVERFLRMVEKYGLNLTEIYRFYNLYELLYFPGLHGLQRYKLTPVQCFQFANIYGFWDGGRRVVREAVLYVPRKFSKTTSTAAIAVYDLLTGEGNAESYTGANSQVQAKRCFDIIRGCMRRLDPGGNAFKVNEEVIRSLIPGRTSLAQCLTANARTKDGLNASTVIMDEFSQARDANLLNVLTTSMGVRANPLTVIITTASDVFDGPFYQMLQGYKNVLLGDYDDDSVFAHIFEPDIDDPEGDEATWRKVHPHLGVTVSLDFYRKEWAKAQRSGAEALLAFRTKLLNVYAENERAAWISARQARENMVEDMTLDTLGAFGWAMVAIDLSVKDDFSAVTFGAMDEASQTYYLHTAYFFPRGALPGHPNETLYRAWASQGHLTLLEGNVIDYDAIVDYILRGNDIVPIYKIGYDRYRAKDAVNKLDAFIAGNGGNPKNVLVDVSQSYGSFSEPCDKMEHGMATGHIKINANPINSYCFGNAVLDHGQNDNRKPIKRTEMGKIDGVITKLMVLRLFLDNG